MAYIERQQTQHKVDRASAHEPEQAGAAKIPQPGQVSPGEPSVVTPNIDRTHRKKSGSLSEASEKPFIHTGLTPRVTPAERGRRAPDHKPDRAQSPSDLQNNDTGNEGNTATSVRGKRHQKAGRAKDVNASGTQSNSSKETSPRAGKSVSKDKKEPTDYKKGETTPRATTKTARRDPERQKIGNQGVTTQEVSQHEAPDASRATTAGSPPKIPRKNETLDSEAGGEAPNSGEDQPNDKSITSSDSESTIKISESESYDEAVDKYVARYSGAHRRARKGEEIQIPTVNGPVGYTRTEGYYTSDRGKDAYDVKLFGDELKDSMELARVVAVPRENPTIIAGGRSAFFGEAEVVVDLGSGGAVADHIYARENPGLVIIGVDDAYTTTAEVDLTKPGLQLVNDNWETLEKLPSNSVNRFISVAGAFTWGIMGKDEAIDQRIVGAITRVAKTGAILRYSKVDSKVRQEKIKKLLSDNGWKVFDAPETGIAIKRFGVAGDQQQEGKVEAVDSGRSEQPITDQSERTFPGFIFKEHNDVSRKQDRPGRKGEFLDELKENLQNLGSGIPEPEVDEWDQESIIAELNEVLQKIDDQLGTHLLTEKTIFVKFVTKEEMKQRTKKEEVMITEKFGEDMLYITTGDCTYNDDGSYTIRIAHEGEEKTAQKKEVFLTTLHEAGHTIVLLDDPVSNELLAYAFASLGMKVHEKYRQEDTLESEMPSIFEEDEVHAIAKQRLKQLLDAGITEEEIISHLSGRPFGDAMPNDYLKRIEVTPEQGSLTIDHAADILFYSFKFSQQDTPLQTSIFNYLKATHAEWKIDDLEAVLAKATQKIYRFFFSKKPSDDATPTDTTIHVKQAYGEPITKGDIDTSLKSMAQIMELVFNGGLPFMGKQSALNHILVSTLAQDNKRLTSESGRPRTLVNPERFVSDPRSSFFVQYVIKRKGTGVKELDEMFGEIADYVGNPESRQTQVWQASQLDNLVAQVLERYNFYHPDKQVSDPTYAAAAQEYITRIRTRYGQLRVGEHIQIPTIYGPIGFTQESPEYLTDRGEDDYKLEIFSDQYQSAGYPHVNRPVAREDVSKVIAGGIEAFFGEGETVLELGSGEAYALHLFAQKYPTTTFWGIDKAYDTQMALDPSKQGIVQLTQADWKTLDCVADKSVSRIMSVAGIEVWGVTDNEAAQEAAQTLSRVATDGAIFRYPRNQENASNIRRLEEALKGQGWELFDAPHTGIAIKLNNIESSTFDSKEPDREQNDPREVLTDYVQEHELSSLEFRGMEAEAHLRLAIAITDVLKGVNRAPDNGLRTGEIYDRIHELPVALGPEKNAKPLEREVEWELEDKRRESIRVYNQIMDHHYKSRSEDASELLVGMDTADAILAMYMSLPMDMEPLTGNEALDRRIAAARMLVADLKKLNEGIPITEERRKTPLEKTILKNFYMTFRFSQGWGDFQNTLMAALTTVYDPAVLKDAFGSPDFLDRRLISSVEKLQVTNPHIDIDDLDPEGEFIDRWRLQIEAFQHLFDPSYERGEEDIFSKFLALSADAQAIEIVTKMVSQDLYYFKKSRGQGRIWRKKKGEDAFESHVKRYLIDHEPTGSEEFNTLFNRIRPYAIRVLNGELDVDVPAEFETLYQMMSELQKIWEKQHSGKSFHGGSEKLKVWEPTVRKQVRMVFSDHDERSIPNLDRFRKEIEGMLTSHPEGQVAVFIEGYDMTPFRALTVQRAMDLGWLPSEAFIATSVRYCDKPVTLEEVREWKEMHRQGLLNPLLFEDQYEDLERELILHPDDTVHIPSARPATRRQIQEWMRENGIEDPYTRQQYKILDEIVSNEHYRGRVLLMPEQSSIYMAPESIEAHLKQVVKDAAEGYFKPTVLQNILFRLHKDSLSRDTDLLRRMHTVLGNDNVVGLVSSLGPGHAGINDDMTNIDKFSVTPIYPGAVSDNYTYNPVQTTINQHRFFQGELQDYLTQEEAIILVAQTVIWSIITRIAQRKGLTEQQATKMVMDKVSSFTIEDANAFEAEIQEHGIKKTAIIIALVSQVAEEVKERQTDGEQVQTGIAGIDQLKPDVAFAREERKRIFSLSWVQEALAEYKEFTSDKTETNFLRGKKLIEVMEQELGSKSHSPSVLLVGLGFDADYLFCSYEPHKIAAYLQKNFPDYQMTLVDLSSQVIQDIQTRNTLFLVPKTYSEERTRELIRGWQQYLDETGQAGRVIYEHEDGLLFNNAEPREELAHGVFAASVSSDFKQRLSDGRIKLQEANIVLADLSASKPFDFVELVNILYQLDQYGQMLALANIASHMQKGGKILMNDIGNVLGNPILSQSGGWLTEEKLTELGLTATVIQEADASSDAVILLTKN